MQVNFSILIFLIINLSTVLLLSYITIKDKPFLYLNLVVQVGLFFYSALGLAFFEIEKQYLYLFQYVLFSFIFYLFVYFFKKTDFKFTSISNSVDLLYNSRGLMLIFVCIYIFTFLFPFIYPNIRISEIFDIFGAIGEYRAPFSSVKLLLQEDGLYQLVTSQIRLLFTPFFYMYLYRLRKKTIRFLVLYLIPIFLGFMNLKYISRNELLLIALFIFIYFISENIFNKKILFLSVLVIFPIVIVFFYDLAFIRVGLNSQNNNFFESFFELFYQETNYVLNYSSAEIISERVTFLSFLMYIVLLPIPNKIISFFTVYQPPEFARLLSTQILGLEYGQKNFYLLLPSVIGEGVMVFNENFAFLYSIILAVILSFILLLLKSNKHLTYLMVYFLLDILRQMRGGSQYIFAQWINMLVPFLIMLFLISRMFGGNRENTIKY